VLSAKVADVVSGTRQQSKGFGWGTKYSGTVHTQDSRFYAIFSVADTENNILGR